METTVGAQQVVVMIETLNSHFHSSKRTICNYVHLIFIHHTKTPVTIVYSR